MKENWKNMTESEAIAYIMGQQGQRSLRIDSTSHGWIAELKGATSTLASQKPTKAEALVGLAGLLLEMSQPPKVGSPNWNWHTTKDHPNCSSTTFFQGMQARVGRRGDLFLWTVEGSGRLVLCMGEDKALPAAKESAERALRKAWTMRK